MPGKGENKTNTVDYNIINMINAHLAAHLKDVLIFYVNIIWVDSQWYIYISTSFHCTFLGSSEHTVHHQVRPGVIKPVGLSH